MTTVGTLSGFQEFFLQPIIKDRPNKQHVLSVIFVIYSIFVREYKKLQVLIQNENIENPSQKLILLLDNMFDYIVRLLVWAVEGVANVSLHPVQSTAQAQTTSLRSWTTTRPKPSKTTLMFGLHFVSHSFLTTPLFLNCYLLENV